MRFLLLSKKKMRKNNMFINCIIFAGGTLIAREKLMRLLGGKKRTFYPRFCLYYGDGGISLKFEGNFCLREMRLKLTHK